MTLPAVLSNLVKDLETAQQSTPTSGGDFQYLKMTKLGEWVYGADETEVGANSAFVIDPSSYAQGFVAWDDGELVSEVMAVAGQTPVTMLDLPDVPAGVKWGSQVSFALKGVEGAEEGTQILYKTSSKGGKDAISKLLAQVIERGKAGESTLCPIIMLEKSSYKHKKYGKINIPVLTVDEWVDLPDGSEPEPEPEAAPEPTPAKRVRKSRAK